MIAPTQDRVISTCDLHVHYRKSFRRGRHLALKNLTLDVLRGEVFGFIGPNGAGKSTTIKALLGFLFPTAGTATVLGRPAGSQEAKRRLGYLPEVALYYRYLTAREILRMYGQLSGLSGADLDKAVKETLGVVGLSDAADTLLSNYSKGMLQRVGIGQALLHDPELLILDEPASGLDPIGRKDLKEIILALHARGKTIFFSSHELSAVESLCDRVCVLNRGEMVVTGDLETILKPVERYMIRFRAPDDGCPELAGAEVRVLQENVYSALLPAGDPAAPTLSTLIGRGADILEVTTERGTLEDYFMRVMTEGKN